MQNRGFQLGAIAFLVIACTTPPSELQDGTSAIMGGASASAYPESVIINFYRDDALHGHCSGAVIAPRVVLTAGHCIDGFDSWSVMAPFSNGHKTIATRSAVYDWKGNQDRSELNPEQHDIGLLLLDDPIALKAYPVIATSAVGPGERVVNIGRVDNGEVSSSALFVGPKIEVQDATASGYPFDYVSRDITQTGDSGGPVISLTNEGMHRIVAVNSGSNGDIQVLARTDLVVKWIEQTAGTRSFFKDSPFVTVKPRW